MKHRRWNPARFEPYRANELPPVFLPGGRGTVRSEGPPLRVRRGTPQQNPYDFKDSIPAWGGEIIVGLRAGRRYGEGTDIDRRFRPGEPIAPTREAALNLVGAIVLGVRRQQVGDAEAGYEIRSAERGRYKSEPEESLRITVYPSDAEFERTLSTGEPTAFFEHLYALAEALGEELEQDEMIVVEYLDGRQYVAFGPWVESRRTAC